MNIELWRTWGEYFKYPKCCVDAFCNEDKSLRGENLIGDPFYHSGFIPCKCCHEKTKGMTLRSANKCLCINVNVGSGNYNSMVRNCISVAKGVRFKSIAKKTNLDVGKYVDDLERML